MKAVVALLVLLMGISVVAESCVRCGDAGADPEIGVCLDEIDLMSGICLQDEFTLKFLPASSTGDVPALKAILEEKEKTLAEEGETAMLMYKIGLLHFYLGNRYLSLELGEEGILHHTGETVRTLERAIELGLEERYLPFAHNYISGAIGTRALHVGILESLFALPDIDRNSVAAIRLGEEFYGPDAPLLSLMYSIRGKRFRDTPWFVGGSLSRAMEYFRRAVELDPGFLGNYRHIAIAYEKMGENDKAIEYWQKVIELPLQDRHKQWGIEAKEQAEEALELSRSGSSTIFA